MKVCDECGGKHYAKNKCKLHYKMPSQIKPKEPTKIANYTMTKRKPIKPVSDKQTKRLAEYRVVRDKYMKEHPICEARLQGCRTLSTDLHHGAGRNGELLTNLKYFKALCRNCHNWVHENDLEAQELGLSFKRLDK